MFKIITSKEISVVALTLQEGGSGLSQLPQPHFSPFVKAAHWPPGLDTVYLIVNTGEVPQVLPKEPC